MIWFSSDWHIGHDKDFLYGKRGFSNITDHDTAIIKNCNELVACDDELWILGDLVMGRDEGEWNRVYQSINCQNIHFIIGNHDSDNKMDKYENEYGMIFHGYADMIKYTKTKRFYLSHYPTLTGNADYDRYPIWNLSGHTHFKTKFYKDWPCIYNVALDAHNNYPVSIEQIIKDIEKHEK